jgi:hypothetical protein
MVPTLYALVVTVHRCFGGMYFHHLQAWFLLDTWFILRPWRQYVPPKRQWTSMTDHTASRSYHSNHISQRSIIIYFQLFTVHHAIISRFKIRHRTTCFGHHQVRWQTRPKHVVQWRILKEGRQYMKINSNTNRNRTHYNIIIWSTHGSSKWSLSFMFSYQIFVSISLCLPYMVHDPLIPSFVVTIPKTFGK